MPIPQKTSSSRVERSLQEKVVLAISLAAIIFFVYILLSVNIFPALGINLPIIPYSDGLKIITASMAAFFCFWYFRGLKTALIGFIAIFWLTWLLEFLSGHLGIFGGTYSYDQANFPGPVIGGTPLFLGFQHYAYYFFMSYFIANLIIDSSVFSRVQSWWKRSLFVSFISSFIVVGIDMLADPVQVNVFHLWQWTNTSEYYSIPYNNYLGYIVIYTILLFVYKYIEKKLKAESIGPTLLIIGLVPLIMYFSRYLEYASADLGGIFLIGGLTMLLPGIIAVDRLLLFIKKEKSEKSGLPSDR